MRESRREPDDADLDAFRAYRRDPTVEARNRLVERHLHLAEAIARRFARRGEPLDDLVQVAYFGLIRSVERFDPEVGTSFAGFAVPTMVGEIKRHFRDRTWTLHVGRPTKDLLPRLREVSDKLTTELGRSPSVQELAGALEVSADAVLNALEARGAYRASSLSAHPDGSDRSAVARLGTVDPGLNAVVDRLAVERLLQTLPERERKVVELRFFGEMTQSEIAARTGISQMHVSRLLRKALAKLDEVGTEAPPS